jgi:EAL domain-containing protein (putative c-di-GMP-specific phosphodiesterase class I)
MPERLVARLVDDAWQCVEAKRAQSNLDERHQLLEILANGQLSSVFQPITQLSRSHVLGYEALVRGPAGTSLQSPARLFSLAGRCELAFELDRACRRQAFAAARELPAGAKLFVNVLPSAMYDPEFQGEGLIGLLADLGLSPERIVLEITEEYAIKNYSLFSEALENLTQMGFSIAVDDVGAGYSGLEKLAHLNPRYQKFDMQLVRNINASFIRREISRALSGFAEKMGSTIIAEGIETEEEKRTIMELGIDYGQGYLLGRPARTFGLPPGTAASPLA